MVHACGAGFVDFKSWRGTHTEWLGLRFRLQAFERTLTNKVGEIDAIRQIATMALNTDQGPAVLQEYAIKGVEGFRGTLMPWYRLGSQQNAHEPIDDIVDWYLTFRPDLIEKALKDGTIRSTKS